MTTVATPSAGDLLREWRKRRHLSQLALATRAEISQRHLSFVESGRSKPSRDMVLKLAEHMSVPLRQRNRLLLAAGFAPNYDERGLDDPSMKAAMAAVQAVLTGHEPYPAIAVDRQWNMIAANGAIGPLLEGVEEAELLQPPVNVLKLALHPKGLAPRIANLADWRAHLIEHLELEFGLDVREQHHRTVAVARWQLRAEVREHVELGFERLAAGEVVGVAPRPAEGLAGCPLDARGVHVARLEIGEHAVGKVFADHRDDARLCEQTGCDGAVGGRPAHDVAKLAARQGQVVERHGSYDEDVVVGFSAHVVQCSR